MNLKVEMEHLSTVSRGSYGAVMPSNTCLNCYMLVTRAEKSRPNVPEHTVPSCNEPFTQGPRPSEGNPLGDGGRAGPRRTQRGGKGDPCCCNARSRRARNFRPQDLTRPNNGNRSVSQHLFPRYPVIDRKRFDQSNNGYEALCLSRYGALTLNRHSRWPIAC